MLGGCVANGPAFIPAPLEPEKGLVYFYRVPGMAYGGEKARINVDGEYGAALRQGGYLWLSLPPGRYHVTQDWWPGDGRSVHDSIDVRAGEVIYYRLITGPCPSNSYNVICVGWNFSSVDPQVGAAQIKSMKYEGPFGKPDFVQPGNSVVQPDSSD